MDEDYYCGFRWDPLPTDEEPDDWHECAVPRWRHAGGPHRCSCEAKFEPASEPTASHLDHHDDQPTDQAESPWEYEYAVDDDPDGNVFGQARRLVGPWHRVPNPDPDSEPTEQESVDGS